MSLGQLPAFKEHELPIRLEGDPQPLGLNSTLAILPAYQFELEANSPIYRIAEQLERFPALPGVILREQGRVLGMLSRPQMLEHLLNSKVRKLLWSEPLRVLHQYIKVPSLWLPGNTSILVASQQVLSRPPEYQSEPIIVQVEDHYRILSAAELNVAHWQIKGIETQVRYERLQLQMLQSDKMADLGRLVDGVAHEILDPVSFIWGNLSHINSYAKQLLTLLQQYEAEYSHSSEQLKQLRDEIEIDYIQEDLPLAIKSVRGGANRLRQLAISLQNFCHIDEVYPKPANLHGLLDSILLLIQSRIVTPIQIHRSYGKLPPIPCFSGHMGQVFMNILVSMIDALLEQEIQDLPETSLPHRSDHAPTITISTEVRSFHPPGSAASDANRWVSIVIKDNGPGLPPEAETDLMQIFSAQTRIVKETSLSMSAHIITAKHGGHFYVRSQRFSQPDYQTQQGTEFEISLPIVLTDC